MLYLTALLGIFSRLAFFAIGGGMATLPFLYDMADKTGWFTRAQLADMIAVSESTPGPIGVNMATYVGFLTGGVPGAVTATVGLIAPSVIVILIVAAFLQAFRDSKYVAGAFYGLRPASTALITAAGLVVVRETFWLTGGVLFWQGIIPLPPCCSCSRAGSGRRRTGTPSCSSASPPSWAWCSALRARKCKEKQPAGCFFLLCALLSPRSRCGWRCAA